jgi:hypothetical protein
MLRSRRYSLHSVGNRYVEVLERGRIPTGIASPSGVRLSGWRWHGHLDDPACFGCFVGHACELRAFCNRSQGAPLGAQAGTSSRTRRRIIIEALFGTTDFSQIAVALTPYSRPVSSG